MNPRLKGSHNEARDYALKLLRYRPRSRKEIHERLTGKGFDSYRIKMAVEYLERAGLIRDDALAAGLFRHAIERKHLGKKGIEMFLSRRGIERELINGALTAHSREMEKETALRLVDKKIKILKNHPENIVKRKLWGTLQRRGFSADIIHLALKSIKETQMNTDGKADSADKGDL